MNPSSHKANSDSNTRPLRLALVVKSLDPHRGGHENYINRLIRGLLGRRYHIWCFAESFGQESVEHENLKKVRITPFKLTPSLRILWFNFRAKRRVQKYPVDFDLVFTTGNVTFGEVYRAGGGVHATHMEKCLGKSAKYRPNHAIAKHLQETLFYKNTPRLLITNSIMVKEDIQRRYKISEERLKVIRNGVDLSRFNPENARSERDAIRRQHGFCDNDFVCLFATAGNGRKGLNELLQAFSGIQSEAIKLLIVGRTKESQLLHTLEKLGLSERVVYAGFQRRIEHYYGAADCFVFPSKYDAAANVVCEALASGTPVITTKTNGSHELIEEGKNGYVIDSASDFANLRRCIIELYESERRHEMRECAIKIGQEYSMERHTEKIDEALHRLVEHKPNSTIYNKKNSF